MRGPTGSGAHFSATHSLQGGEIVIQRDLHMPLMRVAPQAYPAFARFCRQVDVAEGRELVFALP